MKGLQALKRWASSYSSCVIAFSGGVDSTFLLYALKTHTDLHIRAVTLAPPMCLAGSWKKRAGSPVRWGSSIWSSNCP